MYVHLIFKKQQVLLCLLNMYGEKMDKICAMKILKFT